MANRFQSTTQEKAEKSVQSFVQAQQNISKNEKHSDFDIEILNKTWDCIIGQYITKANNISVDEGPGMCVFKMLPSGKVFNCNFFYIPQYSNTWAATFANIPYKDAVENKYKHNEHFLIMIQIPREGSELNSICSVRMFNFKDRSEVPLI